MARRTNSLDDVEVCQQISVSVARRGQSNDAASKNSLTNDR
jgi:hypothetical protein